MKTEPITSSGQMTFLRRRYPLRLRLAKGVIGAVPLADLTFLVLMFIILNSWIVLRPGVFLELPDSHFVSGAHMGASVVTMSREGLIFFNDERISLDELPQRLTASVRRASDSVLVIEADRRITHEKLIRVYTIAKSAGFEEVLLATRLTNRPAMTP